MSVCGPYPNEPQGTHNLAATAAETAQLHWSEHKMLSSPDGAWCLTVRPVAGATDHAIVYLKKAGARGGHRRAFVLERDAIIHWIGPSKIIVEDMYSSNSYRIVEIYLGKKIYVSSDISDTIKRSVASRVGGQIEYFFPRFASADRGRINFRVGGVSGPMSDGPSQAFCWRFSFPNYFAYGSRNSVSIKVVSELKIKDCQIYP